MDKPFRRRSARAYRTPPAKALGRTRGADFLVNGYLVASEGLAQTRVAPALLFGVRLRRRLEAQQRAVLFVREQVEETSAHSFTAHARRLLHRWPQ
jgi:hypothetical protein